jgi:hypothetical protein
MTKLTNPIEIELAAETAANLGRNGARLRKALDALHMFDATVSTGNQRMEPSARIRLVQAAAEAFWSYTVQRELLGVQDAAYIAEQYGVPAEVRAFAGCSKQG